MLNLEQPVLFHLVAEAAKLTLHARGALAFLEKLIGQRTFVRIEAYVDLTRLALAPLPRGGHFPLDLDARDGAGAGRSRALQVGRGQFR